jgi:Tfp pilus assembly protein PilN
MEQQQMIAEVYIWVLSGVLGFLLLVLVFVGKTIASRVGGKLDELVKATIQQTEQIKQLFSMYGSAQKKIDALKNKLGMIEKEKHSCINYKPK